MIARLSTAFSVPTRPRSWCTNRMPASLRGLTRRRASSGWPFDPRLSVAGVGLVVAGEDLDQRRLAGAVLADERVDLAGGDVDADVVERDLPRERLRKVFDSERVSHHPPIPARD